MHQPVALAQPVESVQRFQLWSFFFYCQSQVTITVYIIIQAVRCRILLLAAVEFRPKPFYFHAFQYEGHQLRAGVGKTNAVYVSQKFLSLSSRAIVRKM